MYEVAFHDADPILVAENNLKDTQREIDRLRGCQLGWLKMVIRRRATVRDGCRSLVDWTASRLDIPHNGRRRSGLPGQAPGRRRTAPSPSSASTLCWYHHHIAIHRRGQRIDPDTPPHQPHLLDPGG